MGFSLQRSDRILSRTPLGSPCPSFPWLARVRLAGVETTAFRDTCRFAHRLRQEIVRPRIDACRVLLSQGIGKRTRQGSSACCGLTSSASLPGSTGRRSAGGPEGRCLAKPRTMGRCRLVRCRAAARGTVKCPIAARSGCASSSRTSLACCAGRTIPRRILRFRRAGDTKNEAHLEAPVRRRPGRFRLRVLVPPRVSSPRSLRPVRLTSLREVGFLERFRGACHTPRAGPSPLAALRRPRLDLRTERRRTTSTLHVRLPGVAARRIGHAGIQGFQPRTGALCGAVFRPLAARRTSLGFPALQGLTGPTLQRISPPLPSRSCRTARAVAGASGSRSIVPRRPLRCGLSPFATPRAFRHGEPDVSPSGFSPSCHGRSFDGRPFRLHTQPFDCALHLEHGARCRLAICSCRDALFRALPRPFSEHFRALFEHFRTLSGTSAPFWGTSTRQVRCVCRRVQRSGGGDGRGFRATR